MSTSAKTEAETKATDDQAPLTCLEDFILERHLSIGGKKQALASLGKFSGRDGQAIVLFSEQKLDEAAAEGVLRRIQLDRKEQNTYYGFYDGRCAHEEAPQRFSVTVIHPCLPWHIDKYSAQRQVYYRETPALYAAVMQPHMDSHPASELAWLYALLERRAEQERLLLGDPDPESGFLMYGFQEADGLAQACADDAKALSAMVVVNRRDLPSLRSLDASSLPLLRNIRTQVSQYVQEKLLVPMEEVRLFFHYKPTYFHLHVHVAHIRAADVNMKDHLLDDVIDNIASNSQHYKQASITYVIGEEDQLYKRYQEYKESL